MEDCSASVEDSVLLIKRCVHFVVNRSGCLDVKHEVAESVVGVAHVVIPGIVAALVEVPVSVLGVAGLLVSINHPVHVVEEFLLVVDDFAGGWGDVERHAIVTLNVPDCRVDPQKREENWSRPEVSVHLF